MIHDLDKVKKMFVEADNVIKERPELLSMHIDEIFEEFDGTPEMRHIRWGIMTRAKMTEIKEYNSGNIIDFMKTITEHNLLCEYIGYVLQNEHHISLNKLLIEAYEYSMHKEVLPFVEECLEYEEDCCDDKIDIILDKQKELKADRIKELLIPIPPLPEQHRIVAKIEQLLPIINQISK